MKCLNFLSDFFYSGKYFNELHLEMHAEMHLILSEVLRCSKR